MKTTCTCRTESCGCRYHCREHAPVPFLGTELCQPCESHRADKERIGYLERELVRVRQERDEAQPIRKRVEAEWNLSEAKNAVLRTEIDDLKRERSEQDGDWGNRY